MMVFFFFFWGGHVFFLSAAQHTAVSCNIFLNKSGQLTTIFVMTLITSGDVLRP